MILPIILLVIGAVGTPAGTTSLPVEGQKNPETMGAYVREYYVETPILASIAWCESRFRHVGDDGDIIKNPTSTAIGVMQIMQSVHEKEAEKLGIDITSLDGNLAYAKHLYEKQGTKPWNASKTCWNKAGGKSVAKAE
jgi:soluble lytic murein transglycosylase-like protein